MLARAYWSPRTVVEERALVTAPHVRLCRSVSVITVSRSFESVWDCASRSREANIWSCTLY